VTAQRLPLKDDLSRLDEGAADAMRVILDTADRADRRRVMRLIEACATLTTIVEIAAHLQAGGAS
jgi:hypothetical protein